MEYSSYNVNTPQWREITVGSHLPAELRKLAEIAHNLWWTWNDDAKKLYCDLDPELWKEVEQNPVLLLERMNYEKLVALAHDENFVYKMDAVYSAFKKYVDVEPDHQRPSIAYFSMEYGLDEVLKIYSGGLGMLAGDYLKEASDSNVDLCAIGLLYRYGYFDQSLSMDGQQTVNYKAQNFGQLPIEKVMQPDGKQLVIHVPYADSFVVHANVWKASVGRIPLYLLDTDNELNSEFDRPITHHLYGGDWENRLKQEILLGIGGMMTLKALGITKDVYHCNEGHAALINIQRLCDYINGGLNFGQAMELVRASSLYTVHTPVPAGHDYFDEGLFNKYMKGYPGKLGITWDNLMDLGRHNPGDKEEQYKQLTGRDKPVIDFLEQDGEILQFLEHVDALADAHVQRFLERGFTNLSICFGCTGGQHRSVYSAEHVAHHLNEKFGVRIHLIHREQHIEQILEPR